MKDSVDVLFGDRELTEEELRQRLDLSNRLHWAASNATQSETHRQRKQQSARRRRQRHGDHERQKRKELRHGHHWHPRPDAEAGCGTVFTSFDEPALDFMYCICCDRGVGVDELDSACPHCGWSEPPEECTS